MSRETSGTDKENRPDMSAGGEIPGGLDLTAIAVYLSRRAGADLGQLLGELERRIIIEALESARGNQSEASRKLGVKYTTLNEKIKRHRIALRKRTWVDVF